MMPHETKSLASESTRENQHPRALPPRFFPELHRLKQKCDDPRMHAALDLLAAHDLRLELRTDDLSSPLNLSASRIRHLFQEQLGLSPVEVLKLRRLQAARELLSTTFMRAKEVMAEVGLNDASHFARDFKQLYGVPPKQVKKKLVVAARVRPVSASKRPSKAVVASGRDRKKLA